MNPPNKTASGRKPHRVAYVYDGVTFGGVEIYIKMLLKYLDTDRYLPSVVISAYNVRFAAPEFLEILKELRVPLLVPAAAADSRTGSFPADVVGLRRLFRAEGIDIVHCQTSNFDGGRRATLAARSAGVKAVLRTEHVPPSTNLKPNARWLVKAFDRMTDCIITDSDSNREEQIHLLHRPAHKVYRSYCGIETDLFDPAHDVRAAKKAIGLDPDRPVVGSVVRLAPQKGPAYFVDAAAKVLREMPEVRFLLVGNGELEDELRQQVKALGIEDRFIFAGFQTEYIRYMEAMDVTVMASLYEGFSLGMLASMALGKPCVFTDHSSFREAVGDSGGALLAPVRNSDVLAQHILTFLNDPEHAARAGRAARQRVCDAFSIQRLVDDMMHLYDHYLDPRARATPPGARRRLVRP
ncbi:MAG: glycosyltransferase [Capsulimonadales bacterium]|nr:glycosyltransferase [Capsulimonadales bacterium]